MFNFGTNTKVFAILVRFSSFNWISSHNSDLNCKSPASALDPRLGPSMRLLHWRVPKLRPLAPAQALATRDDRGLVPWPLVTAGPGPSSGLGRHRLQPPSHCP